MPELGLKDDGQPVYQCITVILSGGFQPWLVKATHTCASPGSWRCRRSTSCLRK